MGRHKPETKRRLQAEYRARNREELNRRARVAAMKTKIEVLAHYGGKCVECGLDDFRALQLDHINNDGAAHREEIGLPSGAKFYRWVRVNDYPDTLQVMCANHNAIKQWERFEREPSNPASATI